MRERLAIGAGILALTLLGFFQFPGHTYLGSDTQIYVPMLEDIWDPSALSKDLVAVRPHLSYTLYDEITIALRRITRLPFHGVLVFQQLVYRALQIFGVFLLALSFPLSRRMSMLVAAIFTCGATIAGPAVLVFEYEPVPRGFAVALVFLALGLAAQDKLLWADIAAAAAFLYHPPTVLIFWAIYAWLALRHRDYRDLWPLAMSVLLLLLGAQFQPGSNQDLFGKVSPQLENLQRMRAGYNWLSTWQPAFLWQYPFLWCVSLAAFWRVRPMKARAFLIAMPALGILMMPLSYVLLEKYKFAVIPQLQPARAVLFTAAIALILGAAAGIRAAEQKLWFESVVWFALVLAIPAGARLFSILVPTHAMGARQLLLAVGLAAALAFSIRLQRFRWGPVALACAAILPFLAWPTIGRVRNYTVPPQAGIMGLEEFARANSPKDAMFLFGDAGSGAYPSIFRAEALRAVYVDWKAGGQMNFSESVGSEWSKRWDATNALHFDRALLDRLPGLGIDYLVLEVKNRLVDRWPVYENAQFAVYRIREPQPRTTRFRRRP